MRQPAFSLVSPGFAWTLCLIAIAAELLAIDTGPRAPRFSLAPVYIGAIAWFWSPGLSVGIAASAILLGSLASRRLWSQFTLDLATNFAGLVVASLAILLIPRAHLGSDFAGVGVAVFVCVYAVVQSLSRSILTRSRGENFTVSFPRLLDSPSPAVCAVALLCAVVAVLSRDGLTWVLPFTLVPILALRLGVLRQHQLSESYYDTVTALSLMLQRAHPNTHSHLDRVSRTAELVAQQLGLSSSRAQLVRAAAVLHDIGKIAVDEAVLDKPGPLTVAERAHVENHAVWGAQILSPVQRFQELIPWIRHHHERQDGTGYPDRLSGDQIPIESKIIAVVDAFDAMTCRDRPYRSPLTQDEAILELQRCATTQFDSAVVQAFAEILAEETA